MSELKEKKTRSITVMGETRKIVVTSEKRRKETNNRNGTSVHIDPERGWEHEAYMCLNTKIVR